MKIIKSIFIGFIGGILGALGGADNSSKLWRRLGIPILITIIALIILKHWLVLSIMSLYAILTIGYGIPDNWDGGDKGSPLGRFFFWTIFNGNYNLYAHLLADIFTRGTIAILSCLTFLSIPLLKSNWITYIIGSIIVVTIYSSLSWRALGSITMFGKSLTWSEIIPYTALTTFAMFLIF